MTTSGISPLGDRPLRGALIGAGNISQFHLRAWQQIEGVEIVAICDADRERAQERGLEFGIDSIYDHFETLLEKESLEFVDIATPPHVHAEPTLAAARLGVHVFCQKPFASSLDEARQLIAACESAGIRCVVNENWRWRCWYRTLKRLIDSEVIGKPHFARFTWHADDALPGRDGSPPMLVERQAYTATQSRLILFEWGIHLIDVLRFLFGEIVTVTAKTARLSPAIRGEDLAVVTLEFASGMLGLIDISWGTPVAAERRFVRGMVEPFFVEGSQGTVELDPVENDTLVLTCAGHRERHDARDGRSRAACYQECFTATHRHFIERLRDGQVAENEATDNWDTLAAVFAAYESAASGQTVAVAALE